MRLVNPDSIQINARGGGWAFLRADEKPALPGGGET
jgi:hypothetical protein